MILNNRFALKSVSGSASNGLAFWLSDKTVLKFALSVHCQQQKCSADTLVTGDVSFMGLFYSLGFREEGASSRRTVFTALTHAVH